jgi:hypothetical protein
MDVSIACPFTYINKLPAGAIFVLRDDINKTFNIYLTKNLKSRLSDISEAVVAGCNFEYWSIAGDHVYKLSMAERYRKECIAQGYKCINQKLPFISFKVHLRVNHDARSAMVYLTTAKGTRMTVGIFKKMKEAQEFMDEYYFEGWSGAPVFASNEETARFVRKFGVYKQEQVRFRQYDLVESSSATQTIQEE